MRLLLPLLFAESFQKKSTFKKAFSLVEILVVLAIISILMGIGVMSLKNQGGQEFTKHLSELSGTMELCQTHALSNRAMVRVLMGDDEGTLVVVPLVFSPGGVPTEDEFRDLSNNTLWIPVTKALSLRNVEINEEFVTPVEEIVFLSDGKMEPVNRRVAGRDISMTSMIQFSPSGEVTMDSSGKAVRGVQWGLQSIGGKSAKAIIRVSGLTGRVQVLREEDFDKMNK